jgi:DNA-binding response OmpR family regulator
MTLAEAAAAALVPRPSHSPQDMPHPSAHKRILFVDDDEETAKTMALVLEEAGYDVSVADSVASALKLAEQPPDVLVSDIGLPDGSGLDIIRALRARQPVPGIALSGYGMDDDVARSLEAGFERHLVKPVELSKLVQAIEALTPRPRTLQPD